MQVCDLIVIGSGAAGQRAAIQGAKSGKRVVLIEKLELIGGTCFNTGTIPSKTMREAVLHLSGYQYQNVYGVSYRVKEKISMGDLSFRVQHVIKTEIDVAQVQLSRNGVEVMIRIRDWTSVATAHRPGFPCRIFHVQNRRKPLRCQPITIAGFIIAALGCQSFQTADSQTQRNRSAAVSFGRFTNRCRTPS